jgi:hypothetical protein
VSGTLPVIELVVVRVAVKVSGDVVVMVEELFQGALLDTARRRYCRSVGERVRQQVLERVEGVDVVRAVRITEMLGLDVRLVV